MPTLRLYYAEVELGDYVKALLSGTTKEFGQNKIRDILRDVGIDQYFRRTQDFLGWLNSEQTL